MILLNKQDWLSIRDHAAQMLAVAAFQLPHIWHSNQHQAGFQRCVLDQNNKTAVAGKKRAPPWGGNVGSFASSPNCSHSTTENCAVLWRHRADVSTSAAQSARLCFWFHHSTAAQRANKPFQSNSDWRLGCEPRLRCRLHFCSLQAPQGNYFCHVTLSHPPF